MNAKKYVIFTDLKDFTYKNALLTDNQIAEILNNFEQIVQGSAEKYEIELVKSIGDAYLALANKWEQAYNFAQEIVEISQKYDAKQKIEIKEIGLRVTLTYGFVSQKESLNQVDYFGEAINLCSRMMSITPKGAIFCSQEVWENIKTVSKYSCFIENFQFQWVLTPIPIYSLTELSDEQKQELLMEWKNQDQTLLQECDEIVFRSSCVAALLSLQPIPIIDSYNIVGIHLYMILRLSSKFNQQLTTKSAGRIFLEIVSPLGVSYMSFQGMNTIAKVILPWVWGYLVAPTSFAMTYALWKIYTAYFYYHLAGQKIPKADIKLLFSKQRLAGQEMWKKRKKEIFKTGKNFYKEILSVKSEFWFHEVKKEIHKFLKKK